MILEGRFVIEKALAEGVEVLSIVCSEESGFSGASLPRHTQLVRLANAEIANLVGFKFHHGAVAIAKRPAARHFAACDDDPGGGIGRGAYLCLWNVTDPSNVGALIRSAAGLGASGVLVGPGCADPYYRKAIRASMGTVFSLPLFLLDIDDLRRARTSGCRTIAAALSSRARTLRESAPISGEGKPGILILGNEGFGLPAEILDLCGEEVRIPMASDVDSLNVVVAGGICMYELFPG